METKLILIRHGESLGNATRTYLGHTDLDLSDKGREQAQCAADYFKDTEIEAIYSSDLKRAFNTAVPHGKYHNLEIIATKDLREVNVGEWEGKKIDYIIEKWPQEFCIDWRQIFGISTPPGGEAVVDAAKRMYGKLLSIAKAHKGVVLVTAHAAIIRAFWCYAQGIEPSKWGESYPFPTNASASFVGFDGEKLIPLRFSFDEYISDAFRGKPSTSL